MQSALSIFILHIPNAPGRLSTLLTAAVLVLFSAIATNAYGRPPGPLIYVASEHRQGLSDPAIWNVARPMHWLPDFRLLDPHKQWKPYPLMPLRTHGIMHLPDGPLFVNKERGTPADYLTVLNRLRQIHPDRRIGLFYPASQSLYREAAWSVEPQKAIAKKLPEWLRLRLGDTDVDSASTHSPPGLEHLCDYTTAYGYRLTLDREAHRRGVLAGLETARTHLAKPVYLVTWTHFHSGARKLGSLAGQRQTLDEWRWEVEEIWPLFEGVIIFAPGGIDSDLAQVVVDSSEKRAPGWLQGPLAAQSSDVEPDRFPPPVDGRWSHTTGPVD